MEMGWCQLRLGGLRQQLLEEARHKMETKVGRRADISVKEEHSIG